MASLDDALAYRPTALLIGIAPQGGKIPPAWRATILAAIEAGLDVVSGLHEFVGDDPEFAAAAARTGVELVDHRRPPERQEVAVGRVHEPGKHVILTVGTDCADRQDERGAGAAQGGRGGGPQGRLRGHGPDRDHDRGLGRGRRSASSATSSRAPWSGWSSAPRGMGDWIFVEGQGSLDHPAYSSVTLGLIHGATPHGMVLVHEPGRTEHHGWEGQPGDHLQPLLPFIRLHEQVAGLVAPSPGRGGRAEHHGTPRGRGARRDRAGRGRDRACPPTTRSASAPSGSWTASGRSSRAGAGEPR